MARVALRGSRGNDAFIAVAFTRSIVLLSFLDGETVASATLTPPEDADGNSGAGGSSTKKKKKEEDAAEGTTHKGGEHNSGLAPDSEYRNVGGSSEAADAVMGMAFNADNSLLVTVDGNKTVRVWDTRERRLVASRDVVPVALDDARHACSATLLCYRAIPSLPRPRSRT